MNEKMFIVTEESHLHGEYSKHLLVRERVTVIAKDFLKLIGAQTMTYGMAPDGSFWIEPLPADKQKFSKELSQVKIHDGLIPFKKTSGTHKQWAKLMQEENIVPRDFGKPTVAMYFRDAYGKYQTRLFFGVDGLLYLWFAMHNEIETPDGMREIAGSVFYKAMEEAAEKAEKESPGH